MSDCWLKFLNSGKINIKKICSFYNIRPISYTIKELYNYIYNLELNAYLCLRLKVFSLLKISNEFAIVQK